MAIPNCEQHRELTARVAALEAIENHGVARKPTDERLSTWLANSEAAALSGTVLKGDEALLFEAGRHVEPPTTVDSPFSLTNDGAVGRVVLQLDTNAPGAVNGAAFIEALADIGQTERKFTASSRIRNMFFDGQADILAAAGDTRVIDGFRFKTAVGEERLPFIEGSEIKHFSGAGWKAEGNWNQFRMYNAKITDCGQGLVAQSMQDAKFTSCGFGANDTEQIALTGCSTPMFSQVDVWPPSNGNWKGKFGIAIDNCYGVRFLQGDIETPISLKGSNAQVAIPGSSEDRHRDRWANFSQVFFKVSKEVSEGYKQNHLGDAAYRTTDGEYGPKGFFQLEDWDSLVLDNCQFTFATDPDFTTDEVPPGFLNARPDYLFRFTASDSSSDDALQQDRRGSVFISGELRVSQYVGKPVAEKPGYPVRKPVPLFKRHWSNDPARVNWDGARPQLLRDSLALVNFWVKADGSTVNVADAPIAYLATDPAVNVRHLQDGQTTFAMPTMTSPLAGYSWYFRRS